MKRQFLYHLAALTAAVVILAGAVVGAVGLADLAGIADVSAQGGSGNTTAIEPLPAGATYQASDAELALSSVYDAVIDSVVNVSVTTRAGAGTGSGFVIDTAGHIVTNNHVASDAEYIEVSFADGTIAEATLVGTDADADLAVIQIDPSVKDLTPITFADSDTVFVGQGVMAVGSPFGAEQAFTATTGIVSGLDRSLVGDSNYSMPELIQTDAAINPGNSGGPLFDMAGNVVGVNTAILSGSRSASGVGFAIPANTVRRIVPYLIENGSYTHSWLGISGLTVHPAQREAMNLPDDLTGVMITSVSPNGPVAQTNLRGTTQAVNTPIGELPVNGEIITAVDDQPINQMSDLIVYLEDSTRPGDTINLTVWRNGTLENVAVTLAARPTAQTPIQTSMGR